MDRAAARRSYSDGVEAVADTTLKFTQEQWAAIVCGDWSATQTARHLLATVDWYHEWLDRAILGETTAPFEASRIDEMTAVALETHAHLHGAEAVSRFAERAAAYSDRVDDAWDLPYTFPFGRVTAGLHVGVAAAEWHLHAWDLSAATDRRHEPADPVALFVAAGGCVAAAEGGLKGAALRRLVPLASRRAPWRQMLRRSGRSV